MEEVYLADPCMIIFLVGVFYLIWSLKQVVTKKYDFYNREQFTEESARRWTVVNGLLKAASAVVFCLYGGFGLYGVKLLIPTIAALLALLAASLLLYRKILVRKPRPF